MLRHGRTLPCAQRFGQGNALRKTIFELIAAELLKSVPLPTPDPSVHQPSQHGSVHGPSFFRCTSFESLQLRHGASYVASSCIICTFRFALSADCVASEHLQCTASVACRLRACRELH